MRNPTKEEIYKCREETGAMFTLCTDTLRPVVYKDLLKIIMQENDEKKSWGDRKP
jgi:hypothetical protein